MWPSLLDARVRGRDGGEFAITPLGRAGSMLQRVLIDAAVEVLVQCARDFARSTGPGTIAHPHGTYGDALLIGAKWFAQWDAGEGDCRYECLSEKWSVW
jgi:hypothetical protein